MTGWVLLGLEAVSLAAVAAVGLALLAALCLPLVDRVRDAALRADGMFVLGVGPALGALTIWAALLMPSVLHVLGLRADHCAVHTHHAHLCAVHGQQANLFLAGTGALLLGLLLWRALDLARAQLDATLLVSELEGLGTRMSGGPFPTVLVPGDTVLCVAVGVVRRRVLISRRVLPALPAEEVGAALAHEAAHHGRRDPLLKTLLAWATLGLPSWLAHGVREGFAEAAEQASDAEAAAVHGNLVVASGLVSMARLALSPTPPVALAFAEDDLERRVARLLEGPQSSPGARALPALAALVAAGVLSAVVFSDAVHHWVESVVHLFA